MEKQKLLSGVSEFYIPLKIKLGEQNKSSDSLFPIILKKNPNKLRELFNDSAKISVIVEKEIFDYLLSEGYIIEFEDTDKYIPSAKGIWFYEINKLEFKEDELYQYVTDEYIKKSFSIQKKTLNDTHRLILFVLFVMRCFSREASISLIEPKKFPYWKEIFQKCMNFFGSEKYTKPFNSQKIFDKKATKHPVSSIIMSNAPNLPKLTKFIFKAGGERDGTFFLDILDDKRKIDKNRLNIIFEKIFGDISLQNKEKILEFSNEVLKDYDIKIFDNLNEAFTGPDIKKEIEEIILS